MDIFAGMEIFKRKQVSQEETFRQEICFKLNDQEFSVDIFAVQEIIFPPALSPVPMTPPFVEGIMNLRGKIIPVIDLRKRMNLPEAKRTDATRIIVVGHDGKKIGLIVDSVSEVVKMPMNSVESTDQIAGHWINAEFILGASKIGDRLIILLKLQTVISAFGFSDDQTAESAARVLQAATAPEALSA